MTIYPLSGASWPASKQSSSVEEPPSSYGNKRREMQQMPASSRGAPRQWELRKVTSFPVLDADYWSDASLSSPTIATKLPESIDTENTLAPPLLSLQRDTPPPIRSRCTAFPPPLDSPALREGPYHHLQSLDKVCFTSTRFNGRLLLTQTPHAAPQTRRRFRSTRQNGRLLLQLYEESSSSEMEQSGEGAEENPLEGEAGEEDPSTESEKYEDPIAEKAIQEDPIAEMAIQEDPSAEKAIQEDPVADKAIKADPVAEKGIKGDPVAEKAEEEGALLVKEASQLDGEKPRCTVEEGEEEEEEEESKIEGDERKPSLYTKVLKTLECDAFTGYSAEVLNLKYGRSNGVASFLHKSLTRVTRVRPLTMLDLWQY